MDSLLEFGYLGLFIGTFLAGTILPFSSEFFFIGMLAAGGDPVACLLAATAGNWLGACTCYLIGWAGRWEWIEKYLKVPREKIEKQKAVICKYGVWLALFSWVAVVGNLAVIALGFYKVRPKLTVILLLVGCFARFLFWVLLFDKVDVEGIIN